MSLKYTFSHLFSGRFPRPQLLYEELEGLDDKIENGADAKPVIKENIKLTNTGLKKAFGKNFESIGIVHNEEGSYLIVAKDKGFKFIALEDI